MRITRFYDVNYLTRSPPHFFQLLRADINLPACLRVIGHIRRLGVFKEREVRTQFLLARGSWMKSNMLATDASDAYALVNKCIDVTRLALFDITSQYRAVFADHLESASAQGVSLGSFALVLGCSCCD